VTSVLAQSRQPDEVIVVDDGSTDGTDKAVKGLPVRYLWKENGGISSARNYGIHHAKCDYIAFLDIDDLWNKEKLAVQTKIVTQTDFVLTYTDEIWLRNGQWLNQKKRHEKFSGDIYAKCLPLCIVSASSAMIKKSLFYEVGFFDESLPVCEDYDMWLRICSRYPVLFISQPLIVKRGGHADQLSRSYPVMDSYRIKSLLKMVESGILTEEQKTITCEELHHKCLIVAKGAQKRGRTHEAAYYSHLAQIAATK
jgi:glycosyltransferase involved in cell wall biosynthesis